MKRNKIKTLKKKLAKAFSDFCYKRDKGICQWCGKKITKRRDAHAHHIIARSICNQYGKYDAENNSMLLCFRCHFFRLKAEPFEYVKFLEGWLVERDLDYERLRAYYRQPAKLKIDDYEYLLKKLEII